MGRPSLFVVSNSRRLEQKEGSPRRSSLGRVPRKPSQPTEVIIAALAAGVNLVAGTMDGRHRALQT